MTSARDVSWRLLGVVLTDACNLRCVYCRASQQRRHLPWATLRASIDALLQTADEHIEVTFTGGEPLLAFATLRHTVSYVRQWIAAGRVSWRLVTNGLLLDDEQLSFLDEHRFFVNLSFDGIPEAQALRGPATYGRLDRLLVRLRDRYPRLFTERLKVCSTLTPRTIAHLSDSVGYFLEQGVRSLAISAVTGAVDWPLNRIDELERQFDRISTILLRHYERTGHVPLASFRKSASEEQPVSSEWICRVAEGKSPTLDVDGNTCACLFATSTYQPSPTPVLRRAVDALRLGLPYALEYPERLEGLPDAARAAGPFQHPERRYSRYRKCGECQFLGRCRICPLASASVPGWDDVHRVSDFLCAFNQVTLAHRDRFPCQPTASDFLSGKAPLSALMPRFRASQEPPTPSV